MISYAEAVEKIVGLRATPAVEQIKISAALGAVLAAPLIAKLDRPPAAVSAMDGYAVRLKDVSAAKTTLKLIGAAPAGAPFTGSVSAGQTVRIFTGGEMPTGADHVVIQEDTHADGTAITILPAFDAIRHVRAKSLDFASGDVLLEAGTRLGPAELAIAASANHAILDVYKRPSVALLANGNELKPAGTQLEHGEIINSNPPALSALIRQWGGTPVELGIASDSIESIQQFIARADDADIIVPVGGASVGDHDHMFAAFEALDYMPVFRKVAVKPGKPTWCATKGQQIVLGLPGNPASALVCAHLFLKPLVTGNKGQQLVSATLANDLPANGRRAEFLRAKCEIDHTGQLQVTPLANQDSSLLHPFLEANALLYRDVDAAYAEHGSIVSVVPIRPLSL